MKANKDVVFAISLATALGASATQSANQIDQISNHTNSTSYDIGEEFCTLSTSAHVFFKKGKTRTLKVSVYGITGASGDPTGEIFDTREVELAGKTDMQLNLSGLDGGDFGDLVGVSWELFKNNGLTAVSIRNENVICGCIGCGGDSDPL